MKIDLNQTSFTGGEFAPSLFGRTDIAQYDNACAILENFLIRPYGPIISTPGTEYINACKTGGSTSIVRVIDFVFSRTDAYIIEIGVGYFRFHTNGATVVSTGTTPYEVAHTYTASEIEDIHFAQFNDVIQLAHPDHPPARLTRMASNSWTLTDFPFTGGPYAPDNVIYSGGTTSLLTSATITPSGTGGSITLSASANLFIPSSSTLGHVNTFWKVGALVTDSTTGLDVQGYVKITAVTNPSTASATVVKQLSGTSATTFWAQGAWSSVLGYPARVTFHQQRLFWARTAYQPQSVWGSQSFVYENYSVNGGEDSDALDLTLSSTESNDIKWIASGDGLIAGTFGGDFIIDSGDGSPLTPANTNVKKQTSFGSEAIQPKRIGNFFYYVQRFSKKLRELFFIWDVNAYKSIDKTILSPHISGTGNTTGFKAMAYQQNPDTIIWALCSNGTLATFTREVDQEVQGWSRQTTQGTYESIASIPSQDGPFDEIWVVVKRNINGTDRRYIERFKSQIVPVRQDKCFYVHSGLSYDAYNQTLTGTASSISLSATSGTSVLITSSSARFVAGSVGKRIRAINTSSGQVLGELEIVGYTSSTIVVGDIKYTFDASSYNAGNWGISVSSLTGFDHLESEEIVVCADGGTDKPAKTVSSGTVTLAYNYFVVHGGLSYTQKLKTLPKEAGSQRGTAQGKKQRINEVAFKVNRSFKGFSVGASEELLDNRSYSETVSSSTIFIGTIPNPNFVLQKVAFRDPTTLLGSPELLYTGIIPNIFFRGDYQYGAQILVQNSEPLPIELLSIAISVDTQDK